MGWLVKLGRPHLSKGSGRSVQGGSVRRRGAPGRRRAAAATLLGSGASTFIAVAQAVILIPLSLHYLGPRVYGAWLACAELLVWVQVLDLGLPNLLTQKAGAAFGAGDGRGVAAWFTAGFATLSGLAVAVAALAVAVAPLVARGAGLEGGEAELLAGAFRAGALASAVLLVSNAVVGLARALQRTGWVNLVSVGAALVGFGVAVVLLIDGWGVWALAMGFVARAAVVLAGFLGFMVLRVPRLVPSLWRLGSTELRETLALAPALAGANVGYLMMNHTDIPLVATFFGPQVAAVYALTRKAAEALRGLLDTFGYAAYGGFAHLVASGDRLRSRAVLSELTSLRLAAACVAAGCYLAVNEAFVGLLFGSEYFGGLGLTAAFAALLVVGGHSFLFNYLYRAAGAVRAGSNLLFQESLAKVAAMVVGLVTLGLAGAPAMAAVVSAFFVWLNRKLLLALLPRAAEVSRGWPRWPLPAAVLAAGLAVGRIGIEPTWPVVAATGAVLALAGGLAAAADPHLRLALQRGWVGWMR
jgi:O-antigen/teichoic acid export membrane protein